MQLVLCLALSLASLVADEVLDDRWEIVRMAGVNAGSSHTVYRRVGDRIEMTTESRLKVKRLGVEIEIVTQQTTVEQLDGKLVSVKSSSRSGASESSTEATIADGKARMVTIAAGARRESTVDCEGDVVGPYCMVRRLIDGGLVAGTVVTSRTFSPDMGGAIEGRDQVIGPEEVTLLRGEKLSLIRVDSSYAGVPGSTASWYRADGTLVKTSMQLIGTQIESFHATPEQAFVASQGADAPDLLKTASIVAREWLPRPRSAEAAVLMIKPKVRDAVLDGIGDSRQTIVGDEEDGTRIVRIRRQIPAEGRTGVRPIKQHSSELADALASSAMIQADAPEITSMAHEIIGAEADAWRAAQLLERWVANHMTSRSLSVAFASALEVCRDRAGDCSEYAVLLTALCRAGGIPARVVMGLEYIAGFWGPHAWVEVSIDGEWFALDATNGYGFVDALHLSLARMTLGDQTMGAGFMTLTQALGQIDIDPIEITLAGKRLMTHDAVRVDGDRYVNRLWQLALGKPPGFELHVRQPRAGVSFEILEMRNGSSKIEVDANDLPAAFTWDEVLRAYESVRAVEVDGRSARSYRRKWGAGWKDYTLIAERGALFTIEMTDIDAATAQAVLASLDLD